MIKFDFFNLKKLNSEKLVKELFLLLIAFIIINALKDFFIIPEYMGIKYGTSGTKLILYDKICAFYEKWVCRVLLPFLKLSIAKVFCQSLYLIINKNYIKK